MYNTKAQQKCHRKSQSYDYQNMKIVEFRKSLSWPALIAGVLLSGLTIYAVISGVMIILPTASFPARFIHKLQSPTEYWAAIEFFSYMSILCFLIVKIRVPPIEDPLDKISSWYKYQHSIQDPQNVSIKYALACTLPFIILVVLALLLGSYLI